MSNFKINDNFKTPYRIFLEVVRITQIGIKNLGEVISTTIDKYIYITARYLPPFLIINIELFIQK